MLVLKEAGQQGMPLRRIALNVYNITNSFFQPLSQEDVYADVAAYLRTKCKQSGAPVMKHATRGWYVINYDSAQVQQLLLNFAEEE